MHVLGTVSKTHISVTADPPESKGGFLVAKAWLDEYFDWLATIDYTWEIDAKVLDSDVLVHISSLSELRQ